MSLIKMQYNMGNVNDKAHLTLHSLHLRMRQNLGL